MNEQQTRSDPWIGIDVPKINGARFVAGLAAFSADMIPAGSLFVSVLRSIHKHARIRAIRVDNALARPGVIEVVGGADAQRLTHPMPLRLPFRNQEARPLDVRCLAVDQVIYVGQPVVAIVAETAHAAEAAAAHVEIDYEPLPSIDNAEDALRAGTAAVHPGWDTNLVVHDRIRSGDVAAAFAKAECIVRGDVHVDPSTSAPMEPRCYSAEWDKSTGRLTLRGTFQMPHPSRWLIAAALGLREADIRVIAPNMGGTFGLKMAGHPEEVLVAMLSRMLEQPVAFVEQRHECLGAPGRTQHHSFEIAAQRDGLILGFRNTMVADVGALGAGAGWSMALVTASLFPTVYRVTNSEIDCKLAVTNKSPWQAIRGYGKEVANLVTERAVDMLARKLGLDPTDVRRRNLIPKSAFPYLMPSGMNLDSGDYEGALDQVLELFGYASWRERQRKDTRKGYRLGIGLAFDLTPEGGSRPGVMPSGFETATIRVLPSGDIRVVTSVTSPGGGNETGIAQLVAGVLGVKPDTIMVVQGDTDLTPVGTGNGSSRSLMFAGAAAVTAARDIRQKLAQCAANMLGGAVDDYDFADNRITSRIDTTKQVTLSDVALGAHTNVFSVARGVQMPMEATRSFSPKNIRLVPDHQGRISTYPSFPYSVHAVAVDLSLETGKIDILDYAVVHDCGVMVNPAMVTGQLKGGIVMGIGTALWERLTYHEDGSLRSDRLKSYLMPRAMDLPPIRVGHRCTPGPFHPLGMKGAGESGVGGALSAVTSAVGDALGADDSSTWRVPATAPRLLERISAP